MNKKLFIILLMLWNATVFAEDLKFNQIDAHVQGLLKQVNSSLDLGLMVKALPSGKVWYERNAKRPYVPASTTKLFTAAAALKQLGPNYKFHTQMRAHKNIIKGVLASPLYIRFEGDPRLSQDNLRTLIKRLKKYGVKQVKAKVTIDDSNLSLPDYGPGWMWDDNAFCFSGPIGAIAIDNNCFKVSVKPGQLKAPLQVKQKSPSSLIKLFNHTHTRPKGHEDCYLDVFANANNDYTVKGCMAQQDQAEEWELAITNPRSYAQFILRELFAEEGIEVPRNFYFGKTPEHTPVLADHASVPLKELLVEMLKDSNNLIAGILFKTLGHDYYNTTGRWRNSAKALKAILLDDLDLNTDRIVILDGTGLSRYNLITPSALVALLEYAAKSPFAAEFKQALAVAGQDGTLKDRMIEPDLQSHVQAKTGAMTHVSTLAGFIDQKNGETLAFAIMMNHIPEQLMDYKLLQDKLCRYLRLI